MVSEENIANIEVQLKFWDAVSRDDFDTASQLLSVDYVEHAELPAEFPQNRQGFIQFLAVLRKAFPDAQFEIQNILSDGELVSRGTVRRPANRQTGAGRADGPGALCERSSRGALGGDGPLGALPAAGGLGTSGIIPGLIGQPASEPKYGRERAVTLGYPG